MIAIAWILIVLSWIFYGLKFAEYKRRSSALHVAWAQIQEMPRGTLAQSSLRLAAMNAHMAEERNSVAYIMAPLRLGLQVTLLLNGAALICALLPIWNLL